MPTIEEEDEEEEEEEKSIYAYSIILVNKIILFHLILYTEVNLSYFHLSCG